MIVDVRDGYAIAYSPVPGKLTVSRGVHDLTYSINGLCVFPFQYGNGNYALRFCRKQAEGVYEVEDSGEITADMADENEAFLHPNQYVDYLESGEIPETARALSRSTPAETITAVTEYMSHFDYDYIRALRVKPGAVPDISGCFRKRAGVCQDLAAVAVALCRLNGIPAKLVIGYAGSQYHAWTEILTPQSGWTTFDPTAQVLRRKADTYKPERWY